MTMEQDNLNAFYSKLQNDVNVYSNANTIFRKLQLTELLDPMTFLFKGILDAEITFLVKG